MKGKRRSRVRIKVKNGVIEKEEASAQKLVIKMESLGKNIKQLLAEGLTTKRQVMALRRCEVRYDREQKRAQAEKAAEKEKAEEAAASADGS
jgi:ribosomal protein L12E/L44/L45/RPP1/RPP2